MKDDEFIDVQVRAKEVDAHVMGMEGPDPFKADGSKTMVPFLRVILSGKPVWYLVRNDANMELIHEDEQIAELEECFKEWKAQS